MQRHSCRPMMRAVTLIAFSTVLQAETFKDVEYMYKPAGKEKGGARRRCTGFRRGVNEGDVRVQASRSRHSGGIDH